MRTCIGQTDIVDVIIFAGECTLVLIALFCTVELYSYAIIMMCSDFGCGHADVFGTSDRNFGDR